MACGASPRDDSGPSSGWPEYGGDKGGLRYVAANQITRDNVGDLEVAWTYHSGDFSDGSDGSARTSFNVTPILVDDTLVFCTPMNRVIGIDAETGAERWAYDPVQQQTRLPDPHTRVCRGVVYWEEPQENARTRPCGRRIFTATIDAQLIGIDALTGQACAGFGKGGRVPLREGIGDAELWEYYSTSPPVVVNGVVVVGAMVYDNLRVDAPPGVVRGFDARTGALRWGFDPVPADYDGPRPQDGSYTRGTANVWSILSADDALDLVFVPTGNAATDYFAATRHGLDAFSSSVVALRGSTGELVWSFQMVHKDVWDYDTASQPVLFDLATDTGTIPALAQATKMGHIFLLDRRTGESIFGYEERPVRQDGPHGEVLAPTQPFPTHIPPLHPAALSPDDAYGFTPWDRGKCRELISRFRYDGHPFTPPTVEGSIQYPINMGGANWGSLSVDPQRGVLYVNMTRVAGSIELVPRAEYDALENKDSAWPYQVVPQHGTPYAVRLAPLLSPLGAPCSPPPWGSLTAVDIASGKILWDSPLGSPRERAPWPIWWLYEDLGSPNLGGSIVTAGGVVFIGATTDNEVRAFDAHTGEELWSHHLDHTANATPMSYRLRQDGRQFVVIAAGGHAWSEAGDTLVAFALPE
jgi:quinoprotein glucose dehydrogenase